MASVQARQRLEPVAANRWQLRSPQQPLDMSHPERIALDATAPLWLEYRVPAPDRDGPPEGEHGYTRTFDHGHLLDFLDAVDGLPEDDPRCGSRIAALRNEALWVTDDGLWTPGIHIREGVVTASAVQSVEQDILEIIDATVAVLLGSMSFIVLPGCLVTIAWRPRLPLRGEPTPEQYELLVPALDALELVWFETFDRFRARTAEAWARGAHGGQAGDLAVVAIGCLLDSATPAISDIRERLDTFEYASLPAAPPPASDQGQLIGGGAGFCDFHRGFRDFHRAVGMLRNDVAALVKFAPTRMHFVGGEEAVRSLMTRYVSTVDDLRELKGDIRVALESISGATSAMLLDVAREQQQLARAAQELAEAEARKAENERHRLVAQERRAEGARKRIDLLAAILAPALFWAAVYSAAVWLPGQKEVVGTVILFALMIVSVVGTAAGLGLLRSRQVRRDGRPQRANRAVAVQR